MKWAALALVGLLLAAGITVAARQLSSQPIGLQSEPISAGRQLAPAAHPKSKPKPRPRPRTTTTTRTTTVAPPTPSGGGEHEAGDD